MCFVVGRIELSAHIRDCVEVASTHYRSGCYDRDEVVDDMVSSILPSSIISTHPIGKVCYCQGEEDCKHTVTKEQLEETWCTKGDIKISDIW